MKFEEALAAMREGKRVQRPRFAKGHSIRLETTRKHGCRIVYAKNKPITFLEQYDILATDWQIVEGR